MDTATLTPRQTFREVLAQVAAQARAILPEQVNGRLESAVKLVLAGDVLFQDDGRVEVGSSDPTRYYVLQGPTCTCTDFTQGKAPQGLCKHRIAANMQRSVERVLAQRAAAPPIPVDPDGLEPWPDNDPEPEPTEEPRPLPTPLPEAPASVNVRLTIAGREVQWTLRDTDEGRLAERLAALLARYPLPTQASPQGQLTAEQHNAAAMHKRVDGFCPIHNVQMKLNDKNGRQWWSHRHEGDWCKGR